MLLEYHANPDAQDSSGFTPLQRAIDTSNTDVFEVLLKNSVLNLELRNNNGSTALWLALNQLKGESDKFANRLIERGADPDAIDNKTGNSLLHLAAMEGNEKAAIFLVCHGGKVDHTNHQGEAPIHIASMNNLHVLVQMLLQYGADPNLRTNLKSVRTKVTPIPTITTSSQSDIMSPVSTLGALSALSTMATMSGSSNSIDSAHFHLQQLSNLSNQGSPALSQRKTSNNPFGDDEEEEEIDNRLGNNRSSTGYSITPLNRSTNPSPQIEHKSVKGEVKIVKEFIDEPEKFNTEEDPGRRTALHLAIINKHPEVVNVLLAYKGTLCNTV
jgi:ankyrin repeat protein